MDGAEGGARQVGADEDALELDAAAFELGGLEGDYDCGAVLWGDVSVFDGGRMFKGIESYFAEGDIYDRMGSWSERVLVWLPRDGLSWQMGK